MKTLALLSFLVHTAIMCVHDRRVITSLKYSHYRVKPTIVNGEPVGSDTIPFLVSIKEPTGRVSTDELLWANLCGGSIIGPRRVLTAAHCFEGNNFFYHHHPHLLRVFAGSNRTFERHTGATDTTNDIQVRRISYVVLNRDFHFPSNDIALIFTNVDWNFTKFVSPVTIARNNMDYDICIAAGFGRTGHEERATDTDVLLLARVNVLTRWRCSLVWEMNMDSFLCTDGMLADVAKGDSGGPLACYGMKGSVQSPEKKLLVGVVSGKNFDKTTLFTRVSAYSEWIDSNFACRSIPSLLTIILLLLIYLLFQFHSQLIGKLKGRTSQ